MTVRAAGGLVWRRTEGGDVEVVVVHRPAYDDWSFPKGKREADETDEQTALREVEEETGLRCRLGPELEMIRYRDAKGRDKQVRYWAMTVRKERNRPPDNEVDEVRWVAVGDLADQLSYERDRSVAHSLRTVM